MSYRFLDSIAGPADLKALSNEDLRVLAQEIREEIVAVTSVRGGHVAASLGTVETVLALHSLLDCPNDRIVFDVGHQAYAHKLITGRFQEFQTLRSFGGITGFPNPAESEYDVHPSGHASDSLSVALGLANARDARGGKEHIVAVIGDASIAGGMAFEALNHIGQAQTPMLIVLNDNEMAISHNVGALTRHLSRMRSSSQYRQTRDGVQERMEASGAAGNALVNFGRSVKDSMKQFILPHSMIYEQLGIMCTAPVDGHDIATLREILPSLLEADCPVLLHVVTKKGKGYEPAEADPIRFHGLGAYDIETGKPTASAGSHPTYTQLFGEQLIREAEADERITAITAAMPTGTGLVRFGERFPKRLVDTGIAEEHAVGFASGLALGGRKPVVAIYSTFMQRAFDQIVINCALPNQDVVFAVDRAGLVGDDGPTHHGAFDLAYMRMVPNMRVIVPATAADMQNALHTALALEGPVALRYSRGESFGETVEEARILEEGKSVVVKEGQDVAILAFGRLVENALVAAHLLEEQGISARVVNMLWAKPFDQQAVRDACSARLVVTLEEGVVSGGVGEAIAAFAASEGLHAPMLTLGLPDGFVCQGKKDELFEMLGLDAAGIVNAICARLA